MKKKKIYKLSKIKYNVKKVLEREAANIIKRI